MARGPDYWYVYDLRTTMDYHVASFVEATDAHAWADKKGLGDHAFVTQRDIRSTKERPPRARPRRSHPV